MFYISIKDIITVSPHRINLLDEEIDGLMAAHTAANGDLEEGIVPYLRENLNLRNKILSSLGMSLEESIVEEYNNHRLANSNSKDTYMGTRYVGRSKTGETEFEIMQDIATFEKYEGMADEIGGNTKQWARCAEKEELKKDKKEEKQDD